MTANATADTKYLRVVIYMLEGGFTLTLDQCTLKPSRSNAHRLTLADEACAVADRRLYPFIVAALEGPNSAPVQSITIARSVCEVTFGMYFHQYIARVIPGLLATLAEGYEAVLDVYVVANHLNGGNRQFFTKFLPQAQILSSEDIAAIPPRT